ncbi:hypothetical protein P3L10_027222 [Capsicum annuum]
MAHAAVVSLQQKLHEMLVDENFWFVMLDKNFRFLREVVSFWHAFLEDSLSKRNAPEAVEHLESRVKYLGTQLLDRINLYELEKRSPDFNPLNSKVFPDYIVTAASDSIKEYLMKVMNGPNDIDALTTWNTVESDSECTPHLQDTVLDHDNDLLTIKSRLIGRPSKLDVVSIIGMGGIGKTTLARQVYDDIYMEHHFYIRAWITVSQMHQCREMLLGILRYFSLVNDNTYRKSTEELAEQVYRSLKGRRYLIAMDDVWDTNAWDDMKRSFPDDKNGSRVILTSRLANTCPSELEKATMQVVEKCEGLPLAIVVVAEFCSKISKMRSRWEDVAHKIGQVACRDTEECLNLLVLSYNHLPQRLKPCFLYMGAFPKNFEISVSRLIKLWIAAEFVKCTPEKDFEEVAEGYLRDLIDRSLIMVKKRTSGGKVKTCEVHDLLHDLIIRESRKDRSIHFTKSNVIVSPSAASFEKLLPKLEVLKLKYYAFRGSEWEPTDERFQQLKFLLLDGTDLIHWKASSIQFPKLESLVLKNCYCLYEIPDDVAEIPTLQFIELYNCSSTADDSANRILEEQLSLGNDDLVVKFKACIPFLRFGAPPRQAMRPMQRKDSSTWLAIQQRLAILDKLSTWGVQMSIDYVLLKSTRPKAEILRFLSSATVYLYHVDLLSRVKGQVESLHRELSLMKAFLKVSREKRSELPNSFNF